MWSRFRHTRVETARLIAALSVVASFVLAFTGVAVFRGATRVDGRGSLWSLLLADPATLGFVRLAVVLGSIYVIASVPALIASGRWIRGLGPSGISTDEATAADERVGKLEADLEAVRRQRDEAKDLARELKSWLNL